MLHYCSTILQCDLKRIHTFADITQDVAIFFGRMDELVHSSDNATMLTRTSCSWKQASRTKESAERVIEDSRCCCRECPPTSIGLAFLTMPTTRLGALQQVRVLRCTFSAASMCPYNGIALHFGCLTFRPHRPSRVFAVTWHRSTVNPISSNTVMAPIRDRRSFRIAPATSSWELHLCCMKRILAIATKCRQR